MGDKVLLLVADGRHGTAGAPGRMGSAFGGHGGPAGQATDGEDAGTIELRVYSSDSSHGMAQELPEDCFGCRAAVAHSDRKSVV